MIFRRLNKNSEQQASIESGPYTLQYVVPALVWWNRTTLCPKHIFTLPSPPSIYLSHFSAALRKLTRMLPSPLQLPNTRLRLLPLHLRPLLSPQTRLHLPLRPLRRVHNDLPLNPIPLPDLPTLRLRRIRHLHPTNQENLLGHSGVREPRQTQRRTS